MALENQASSDRAGYRIPGADHRKWPCQSRSRAVVHLLRGWSGHLLEVNLAWTGSMPSLVVAAGRAKDLVIDEHAGKPPDLQQVAALRVALRQIIHLDLAHPAEVHRDPPRAGFGHDAIERHHRHTGVAGFLDGTVERRG